MAVSKAQKNPVAGVDYPSTWQAFEAWFPDDATCLSYLEKLRWPQGFVCPVCGGDNAWRTKQGLWLCTSCRRKLSATAGTIFHRSRLPLRSWFAAIWFVTSQKNGVSALGLKRVLGFGSYQTAWAWLHKLRRAMVRPDRELLKGLVEVDETYIGARERGRDGRGVEKKRIVAIAVELLEPKGFGRIRLSTLPELSQSEIFGFMSDSIERGSVVRTDGWDLYKKVPELGFVHDPVSVVGSGNPAHAVLPGVHRIASLLKRWLAGTLHDGVSDSHLDYYLDEFTFRFNRRTSRQRGLLFYRLLQQAANTDPHPYKELIASSPLDHYIWG